MSTNEHSIRGLMGEDLSPHIRKVRVAFGSTVMGYVSVTAFYRRYYDHIKDKHPLRIELKPVDPETDTSSVMNVRCSYDLELIDTTKLSDADIVFILRSFGPAASDRIRTMQASAVRDAFKQSDIRT